MSVTVLTRPDESDPPRLAGLIERGLIERGLPDRGMLGHGLVGRASEQDRTGSDQVHPLRTELRALVPWGGLRRGVTVAIAVDGSAAAGEAGRAPGSTSLLLALLAEAVCAGSWCGVIGVPGLGAAAAAEQGIDLGRLALVPYPGTEWVTAAAALLDGLDIVVVRPSGPVTPKLARRLAARARQRGGVLISYGSWAGADVTLRVTGQAWHGLGAGRGRLRSRELSVVSYGRGAAARPRSTRLWLPAAPPDGELPAETLTPLASEPLAGTALTGTALTGTALAGTALTGTALTGTALTSEPLAGTALAGELEEPMEAAS